MPSNFNPLPEQEQSLLLRAMKEILSSGRIPQDVSNELIMVAILEMNGSVRRTTNQSRRNAIALRWLGAGLLLIVSFIAVLHGNDGILQTIAGFIGV